MQLEKLRVVCGLFTLPKYQFHYNFMFRCSIGKTDLKVQYFLLCMVFSNGEKKSQSSIPSAQKFQVGGVGVGRKAQINALGFTLKKSTRPRMLF